MRRRPLSFATAGCIFARCLTRFLSIILPVKTTNLQRLRH